ncbi:MAG: Hpt domain-containing protein [Spirochaetia bacterium]|nr:Hpt domain-containing protein [Spirochaetia bacterium]
MSEKLVINIERLQLLFDGDLSLLQQIFEIVQTDFPLLCTKLGEAIAAGNIDLINRHAHTLKGSLANVGGDKASLIAAEIDASATQKDLQKCAKVFSGLQQAIDNFLVQLKAAADGELT